MPMYKFRTTPAIARTLLALLLTGVSAVTSLTMSETVYKSVDAEGNVTYSSTPPATSVASRPVQVRRGPTDAQRQEAEQIDAQIEKAANQQRQDLAASRKQRITNVRQTENTLAQAKADLEQAQVIQDSDWQHVATGGRNLKESYFQRVQQAEDRVRAVEQELATTRRDTR